MYKLIAAFLLSLLKQLLLNGKSLSLLRSITSDILLADDFVFLQMKYPNFVSFSSTTLPEFCTIQYNTILF